jgi:cell division protein FtsL
MMRILNILVIGALVAAAAYVYKTKFESTRQAERLAKLRMEIRQEQDAIASLRAEWSRLDTPARIQELAKRHLSTMQPIDPRQIDTLRNLPERPPDLVPPDAADPIGSLLENPEVFEVPTTSSISAAPRPKR